MAGIILSFTVVFHVNNNPANIISGLFKQGGSETGNLGYKVYLFGVLPVGEAEFQRAKSEEYEGRAVYHLHAHASSLKIFEKIFKAAAFLDSYVDMRDFNPLAFRQKLSVSGKPDVIKEAYYDQEKGMMFIGGLARQILPNTQDALSAIFNIQRMDFSSRCDLEFNLNTNQKNYIMQGTAQPKEIAANKKIYKTAVLTMDIRRRDKNPYHKSSISVVLLTEYGNIPLLIKVFAGGFLLTVKLVEANRPS